MKNFPKNSAVIIEATTPTIRFETEKSNVSSNQKINDNMKSVMYFISLA
jgi:hypothetical protein